MTQLVTPHELVDLLQPVLEHGLIGFDVDGVLAPIVDHADQAQLSAGVAESLTSLSQRASVMILSGRSLESLGRLFDFAPQLRVVGSHGLEVRGASPIALDDREQTIYDQLRFLGEKAVEAVGRGGWLEFKPASVVVHTRKADDEVVQPTIEALENLASMIEGSHVKRGHSVVELLARTASKGDALLGFAGETGRAPLAYLGDDLTDEDAFQQMSANDVSVRVGEGDTAARFRLADTAAVSKLLGLLR
ncbi:MAG TPA: trehalose-phosphatase [Ilumatobacter sp.]|nr:trehalose-phosphatase [Ilumatobacter sp.]